MNRTWDTGYGSRPHEFFKKRTAVSSRETAVLFYLDASIYQISATKKI